MNYRTACHTLQINKSDYPFRSIPGPIIKKHYREQSLINHPDKNNSSPESIEKFQKINEAYLILNQYADKSETELDNLTEDSFFAKAFSGPLAKEGVSYSLLVGQFISSITFDSNTKLALQSIFMGCCFTTEAILRSADVESCEIICGIICKYQAICGVDDRFIDKIQKILVEKQDNDTDDDTDDDDAICAPYTITLAPSMDDLFDNNVFQLYLDDGQLCMVPLWYQESKFDTTNGGEVTVICNPVLPPNVTIDSDNTLRVALCVPWKTLIEEAMKEGSADDERGHLSILLGTRVFEIPVDQLYVRKTQQYTLVGRGPSLPQMDVYDVSEKADIIITIYAEQNQQAS